MFSTSREESRSFTFCVMPVGMPPHFRNRFDFVYMLNQAGGDRQILARQLGISPHQLSYVTHSGEGEGLLFYGSTILPFVDHFPKNTELYRIMTTKPQEMKEAD